ncbi:FAD-binding oxidoreductase [Luteolibacter flavescens]|uniref:FAD-binding oxidoreductase n=1 Tax=Luteolibacter flavescens TaxID=1859460 RepID=A0ABT3FLV7_9BACT|nr:FAD-dependent oxidoreductase [Luteolibacter flavescens]MCW1884561.1 FAD-binding oxidoreductase [Luteolibacter flavescens]
MKDRAIGRSIHITGMGLAGCCLAWQRHFRGEGFTWEDDDRPGAASKVAAGLVNPVTGKNFSPSWRLAEFLPEAEAFYAKVGELLGRQLWFSYPVWRLVAEGEWAKVESKLGEAGPWLERIEEDVPGWSRAVVLKGGGRVATREFCEGTRAYFSAMRQQPQDQAATVWCEGAAGLIAGRLGRHRCAKGEILTLRAGCPEDRILIGGGGWLVPVGGGLFKVGSTYVWDRLDGEPTDEGRAKVEKIARLLVGEDFEVIAHDAGVRPIVRKSQPVIGPLEDGRIVFNGLGSKGSLYAPGVATRLAAWLAGEADIESELDVRCL